MESVLVFCKVFFVFFVLCLVHNVAKISELSTLDYHFGYRQRLLDNVCLMPRNCDGQLSYWLL